MEGKLYADNYVQLFREEGTFLDFLKGSDSRAAWKTQDTNKLRFTALDDGSEISEQLIETYRTHGKEDVIEDTIANTKLVLKLEDDYLPIRSCAIKTILDRAQINGSALRRVSKPVLARMLNDCMRVGKGTALVKYLDDKVSAVHGGDKSDYAILNLSDLFRMTSEYLRNHYSKVQYKGGTFDHSLVSAIWELSGEDAMIETYKASLKKHGVEVKKLTPSVQLASSDIGISGANLYPQLITESGRNIPLGHPLKLEHKNGATLKDFEQQLAFLYSHYQNTIQKLAALLDVHIQNPVNTMMGVMKKIGIPKKLAFEAIDLFRHQCGTDPCSAHDLYYGIAEVIFMVQVNAESDRKGTPGMKVLKMEETVMRALNIRWQEYDIPGDIIW